MEAWLTPDSSQLTNPLVMCRTIQLPGDLFYLVTGCLELLAQSHNWESFGTATPDQMAEFFRDILDDYTQSVCGGSGMKYLDPQVQLLNANHNGGIQTWTYPLSSLPDGATAVLLQVSISPTASGTFVGGGAGLTPGVKGGTTRSVTVGASFFQFLCPVAEQGIRFNITGMGSTWFIVVSIAAYM